MRKVGIHPRTNLIAVLFVCFDVQTTKARRARFNKETRGIKCASASLVLGAPQTECTHIKSFRIGGDVIIKLLHGVPPLIAKCAFTAPKQDIIKQK